MRSKSPLGGKRAKKMPAIWLIEQEVLAEFRDRRGTDFPQSVGGQWMVNLEVSKRFIALLAKHGAHPPTPGHPIVYGSDRSKG